MEPRRRKERTSPQLADDMESSTVLAARGIERGALFAYQATAPVSAGRGRSVMVPIVSNQLDARRELLYRSGEAARGNPPSPMATLRAINTTGLTLERGPVTVLEHGAYGGEAIVSFTPPAAEITVPYAVELGITVLERRSVERVVARVRVAESYLLIEERVITTSAYVVHSDMATDQVVLIEHVRIPDTTLIATPPSVASGEGVERWEVPVGARSEATLTIREGTTTHRYESVESLDGDRLHVFLADRVLSDALHDGLADVLTKYRMISDALARRAHDEEQRERLGERQDRARKNLSALATDGSEGELRSRYVTTLSESEDQMVELDRHIAATLEEEARLRAEISAALTELSNSATAS
jgi:hypothetical protein